MKAGRARELRARGFTLVELMIVIAIVGVLAALAIYGTKRYLAAAKTSEAKNNIGAIARAACAAYERYTTQAEDLAEGSLSANNGADVCNSSTYVPTVVPPGKKYQPKTTDGKDFDADDVTTGWKCLRFSVTQPIYYRYRYGRGTATQVAPNNPATVAGHSKAFEASAEGDLDADGKTSKFALTGNSNLSGKVMKLASQVYIEDEYE